MVTVSLTQPTKCRVYTVTTMHPLDTIFHKEDYKENFEFHSDNLKEIVNKGRFNTDDTHVHKLTDDSRISDVVT